MEEQQKSKSPATGKKRIAKTKAGTKLTKVSVKRTAKKGVTKPDTPLAGPISTEQRRQLIAEAAYFRALSRGFAGGDPVADWLEAEREVDQAIADKAK